MTIMLPGSRMCAVHEYCSWSTTLMYQSARIPTHTSTLVYFIYLHLFESILISSLRCILILYKSYVVLSLYVPTSPSALVGAPDACKHVDARPSSFSQRHSRNLPYRHITMITSVWPDDLRCWFIRKTSLRDGNFPVSVFSSPTTYLLEGCLMISQSNPSTFYHCLLIIKNDRTADIGAAKVFGY